MCLGFEGTLISVTGSGVTRSGLLLIDEREIEIGLAFVPEAEIGDRLLQYLTSRKSILLESRLALSGPESPILPKGIGVYTSCFEIK